MLTVSEQFSRPIQDSANFYKTALASELKSAFKLNQYAIPQIAKIMVSITVGTDIADKKLVQSLTEDLANITGQKPVLTLAKKSVASFKVRAGMPVGLKVTLRKKNMYFFLNKLVHIALPRIKDFRGLNPNAFDATHNYNIGIKDYTIFPEVNFSSASKIYGMNITINLKNTSHKDQAAYLLRSFGFPITEKYVK